MEERPPMRPLGDGPWLQLLEQIHENRMAALSAGSRDCGQLDPPKKSGHSVGSAAQKPPYVLEFSGVTGSKSGAKRCCGLVASVCDHPPYIVLSYELSRELRTEHR
jgi:hypothetical protein